MAKTKRKATDPTSIIGANTGAKIQAKPNSGVTSIILDTKTNQLPGIIWSFRNGRKDSVGYEDPTFFGFALDIHSQPTEAAEIFNPYTGIRANPLFYQPTWANLSADGSGRMDKNDSDTKFPELTANPSEACALQFLNSYTLNLSETRDILAAKGPLIKAKADNLTESTLMKEFGGMGTLNRGYYLMEFIKTLNYIQEKAPWTFTEMDGVAALWKATQPGYDYKPIEINITSTETVDLRLTKLAESYRLATYDSFNGRKLLAPNLEKFSMDIYLMDMRFIKDEYGGISILSSGSGSASYDESFSAQVNFGGIAFRCMGCRFDFSGFMDNQSTGFKSAPESAFQPKFKIIIDRVVPATYFGDKAFGTSSFGDETVDVSNFIGNALGGALDLGPFTGGVTKVLSAGKRELGNLLGAPQRWVNDQLLGITRKFDEAAGKFVDELMPSQSRPFEKKDVTTLINERRVGNVLSTDVFPGFSQPGRSRPINSDVFPGVDNRKARPIKRDEFTGVDVRTTLPINQDVFPSVDPTPAEKISRDVFPGDVPVSVSINQRKVGGKITSQNPYKP